MKKLFRAVDANINRVAEGLRVLEDLARFYYEDSEITEELKTLRHFTRKTIMHLQYKFLEERDAAEDIGLTISQKSDLDNKTDLWALVSSNFKRVQEGFRVIEETLNAAGFYQESKSYEQFRYKAYSLEKFYIDMMKGEVK